MCLEELAFSIVLQAIEDYKLLRHYHRSVIYLGEERISRKELEDFFKSEYCDELLSLTTHLNGRDILRYLNRE